MSSCSTGTFDPGLARAPPQPLSFGHTVSIRKQSQCPKLMYKSAPDTMAIIKVTRDPEEMGLSADCRRSRIAPFPDTNSSHAHEQTTWNGHNFFSTWNAETPSAEWVTRSKVTPQKCLGCGISPRAPPTLVVCLVCFDTLAQPRVTTTLLPPSPPSFYQNEIYT